MEKLSIARDTGGGGNKPQGRQEFTPIDVKNNLTCHPELVSGSYYRNITTSPENINNIPSAFHTAKRYVRGDYVPQKESKTEWLSKQLCHPEFISGSSHRNIIPSPENINNISSTSRTAKRRVRGGSATRKVAFTLAEVLITLGVIGVVAALTLPAFINNYEKHLTVTRLKYSYDIFSNMIRRAEADYGDITEWGIDADGRQEYDSQNQKIIRTQFTLKYILPYLQGAEFTDSRTKTYAEYGYKTPIVMPSGKVFGPLDGFPPIVRLSNGMIVVVTFSTMVTADKKTLLSGLLFAVDINGPSGKNQIGRDVFIFVIPFVVNTKVLFYQYYTVDLESNYIRLKPEKTTRSFMIDDCKSNGMTCGYLIQNDGWQIKDDYPW